MSTCHGFELVSRHANGRRVSQTADMQVLSISGASRGFRLPVCLILIADNDIENSIDCKDQDDDEKDCTAGVSMCLKRSVLRVVGGGDCLDRFNN
jgi:hypothetical protein